MPKSHLKPLSHGVSFEQGTQRSLQMLSPAQVEGSLQAGNAGPQRLSTVGWAVSWVGVKTRRRTMERIGRMFMVGLC